MSKRTLNKAQFKVSARQRKDPNPQHAHEAENGQAGNPKFGGGTGSKTMTVAAGRLPKPQIRHRHHRKNAPRTRRAR